MRVFLSLAATGLFMTLASGAAVADDRAPTLEERSSIEATLKAEGFTSWGEIELEDGKVWEVDDAIHSDGREYDLELDPKTYKITQRDAD